MSGLEIKETLCDDCHSITGCLNFIQYYEQIEENYCRDCISKKFDEYYNPISIIMRSARVDKETATIAYEKTGDIVEAILEVTP